MFLLFIGWACVKFMPLAKWASGKTRRVVDLGVGDAHPSFWGNISTLLIRSSFSGPGRRWHAFSLSIEKNADKL